MFGRLVGEVERVPTPYPCPPARLIEMVVEHVVASGCSRIGVGFPGEMNDGLVVEPGNLSRGGGIATAIDPTVHEQWLNTNLQRALHEACHQDVRVVNDATLAALGYCEGNGRELVFTLGTGFGIALVIDGTPKRIRDIGAEIFLDGLTYDELLGEPSRFKDEDQWRNWLSLAVSKFVDEFAPDTVHIGGGNARRIQITHFDDLSCHVVEHDNEATLSGASKLFAN